MKVKNWKKYVTSAAAMALMGSGVIGATQIDFSDLGVSTTSLEAATGAVELTTGEGIKIVSFGQFVLQGTTYDPLANVSAFGVANGTLVNLTEHIRVAENNVDLHTPGKYDVVYEVAMDDVVYATDTVSIVVGLEPSESLVEYTTILEDLGRILEQVELDAEAQADIAERMQELYAAIDEVSAQYQVVSGTVENNAETIDTLREELQPLQESLAGLYSGTVNLYTAIENLEESHAIHKAMAETERIRLENQLESEKVRYEETIERIQSEIDNAGDGEEIDGWVSAADTVTERYHGIVERVTNRLEEVKAELHELDRLDAQSEGRDQIIQKLIESNKAEIDALEIQINEVVAEKEAAIAALSAKFEGKLDKSEKEELEQQLESVKEYYDQRESEMNERMGALQSETEGMTEKEAVYANRLTQLREKLDALRLRERAIEQEITEHLDERQGIKDALDGVDGVDDEELADSVVDDIIDGGLQEDQEPDTENDVNEGEESLEEESPSTDDSTDSTDSDAGVGAEDEVVDNGDVTDAPDEVVDNGDVTDAPETPAETDPDVDTDTGSEANPGEDTDTSEEPVDVETPTDQVVEEDVSTDDQEDTGNFEGEQGPVGDDIFDGEDNGDGVHIVGEDLSADGVTARPDGVTLDELLGLGENEIENQSLFRAFSSPALETATTSVLSTFSLFSDEDPDEVVEEYENQATTYDLYAAEGEGDDSSELNSLLEQGVDSYNSGGSEAETQEAPEGEQPVDSPATQELQPGVVEGPVDTDDDVNTDETESENLEAIPETQEGEVSEEGSRETVTEEDDGELPQTGATYGALGIGGASLITALGGLFIKRRRNK